MFQLNFAHEYCIAIFGCGDQVESGYQAMVAFKCGYPAMYLTENGWKKDDSTDCVDDVEDVLIYCKKVSDDMNFF